jgi:hypothetical protein
MLFGYLDECVGIFFATFDPKTLRRLYRFIDKSTERSGGHMSVFQKAIVAIGRQAKLHGSPLIHSQDKRQDGNYEDEGHRKGACDQSKDAQMR